MKKIYIAKSKVGNPDDLMNLRSLLRQWDCEVTEWFGGSPYSPHTLDQADILIIIPPAVGRSKAVGKGQHMETNRFIKAQGGYEYAAFMATEIDNEEAFFERVKGSDEFHTADWTCEYGQIQVHDHYVWELGDIMDTNDIHLKKRPVEERDLSLLLLRTKKSKL